MSGGSSKPITWKDILWDIWNKNLPADFQIFIVSCFTKFFGHLLMAAGIASPGKKFMELLVDLLWFAPAIAIIAFVMNTIFTNSYIAPKSHYIQPYDNLQLVLKFVFGVYGFVLGFCPNQSIWFGMLGMTLGLYLVEAFRKFAFIRHSEKADRDAKYAFYDSIATRVNLNGQSNLFSDTHVIKKVNDQTDQIIYSVNQRISVLLKKKESSVQELSPIFDTPNPKLHDPDNSQTIKRTLLQAFSEAKAMWPRAMCEALLWAWLLLLELEEAPWLNAFADNNSVKVKIAAAFLIAIGSSAGYIIGGRIGNTLAWVQKGTISLFHQLKNCGASQKISPIKVDEHYSRVPDYGTIGGSLEPPKSILQRCLSCIF